MLTMERMSLAMWGGGRAVVARAGCAGKGLRGKAGFGECAAASAPPAAAADDDDEGCCLEAPRGELGAALSAEYKEPSSSPSLLPLPKAAAVERAEGGAGAAAGGGSSGGAGRSEGGIPFAAPADAHRRPNQYTTKGVREAPS